MIADRVALALIAAASTYLLIGDLGVRRRTRSCFSFEFRSARSALAR